MDKENNKLGRPTKYKEEYNQQVYKLCLLGSTDAQIADFFEVAESTVNLWKKEYPEFSEAIKKGKVDADATVAERLYKRATGYQYKEVREEYDTDNQGKKKDQKQVRRTETTKTLAPDPTAQIFWLKNRQPEKWRDTKNIDHTTKGDAIEGYTKESVRQELKDILSNTDD